MSRSNITGKQIRDDSVTGEDIDESTLVFSNLSDTGGVKIKNAIIKAPAIGAPTSAMKVKTSTRSYNLPDDY